MGICETLPVIKIHPFIYISVSSSRYHACVHAPSLQSRPTLCDSMDCGPPDSWLHGILLARYWCGLPCPPQGEILNPGIEPASLRSPALAGGFFTTSATLEVN